MDRTAFWPFPKTCHSMNGDGPIETRYLDRDSQLSCVSLL